MSRPPWHVVMLGVWSAAFVVVQLVAAEALADGGIGWPVALAPGVVLGGVLLLRSRTPDWFVHVSVAVLSVAMLVNCASATSGVQAVTAADALLVPVIYMGLWNKPALALLYAAAGSIGTCTVFAYRGWPDGLLVAWIAVTGMLFGVAVVLAVIIGRTTHLAYHDSLTGMLNRTGLDAYLRTHAVAGRASLPRTLVIADVDGLKRTNDSFGHAAGDALLRELADSWRNVLRPDDVVVRMGGDEFLVILPQTPVAAAGDVLARLRAASSTRWSAGVADWPADTPFDIALAVADAAMYAEKETRRRPDR